MSTFRAIIELLWELTLGRIWKKLRQRVVDFIDSFGTDPTDDWPRRESLRLELTLPCPMYPKGALNGVAPGDPYDRLVVFGKPSNPAPFKRNRFFYPHLGLLCEGGETDAVPQLEFVTIFIDAEEEGMAMQGELSIANPAAHPDRGGVFHLRKGVTLEELEAFLGAPSRRKDDDELEISTATFRFGELELSVAAGEGRHIEDIAIYLEGS